MGDFSRIEHAISAIYAAGEATIPFEQALNPIHDLFEGVGVCLFRVDRDTGQIDEWFAAGRDQYVGTAHIYVDQAHSFDPRLTNALACPERMGDVLRDYDIFDEKQMDRHEFYRLAEQEGNIRYGFGTRLADTAGKSVIASIAFPRCHGYPDDDEAELFTLITRHLRQAYLLNQRLARLEQALGTMVAVAEAMPWGILIVDRKRHIISGNKKAMQIFDAADGLFRRNGVLGFARGPEVRKFDELAKQQFSCADKEIFLPRSAMMVPRTGGGESYLIELAAMRPHVLPNFNEAAPNETALVVFITDPRTCSAPSATLLREMFGLSVREAELAHLFGLGLKLEDIAERMQISRNTAKIHLRNVFWKTGASDQVDLARLMARLLS